MKTAGAVWIAVIVFTLSPQNPQCENQQFARANPGICQYTSSSGPFPDFGNTGGGGGGGGGLLGGILKTVGKIL